MKRRPHPNEVLLAVGAVLAAALWFATGAAQDAAREQEHKRLIDDFHKAGQLSRPQEKLDCYLSILRRAEKVIKDPRDLATLHAQVARQYHLLADFGPAEYHLRISLDLHETAHLNPENNKLNIANAANNLGYFYLSLGMYSQARERFRQSLDIWKAYQAAGGSLGANAAKCWNNMGMVCQQIGDLAAAEEHLRFALAILRTKPEYAVMEATYQLNLAWNHQARGDPREAERLYRLSLEKLKTQPAGDWESARYRARGLSNLGWLCHAAPSREDEAENLYREALGLRQDLLPKDHPDIALSHDNLAGLYALKRDWVRAAAEADTARQMLRRHVGRALPLLHEAEQLAYLHAHYRPELDGALSLALAHREVSLAERTAGWVLNGKAVAQEALAQRMLLNRDRDNPQVRRLERVRKELTALAHANPNPAREADRQEQLKTLSREEQDLVRDLGRVVGGHIRAGEWVELDEVRKRLPERGVLVEIVRLAPWNFRMKATARDGGPERYVAWVIPPINQGNVRVVDLGEAKEAETLVERARQQVRAAEKLKPGDLLDAEQEKAFRRPLEGLTARILQPLLPHIGGRDREWIISPDGDLWLVPWAALPLPGGKYAIQEHPIRFVVSGRDLLAGKPQARATPPALWANPQFDLNPADAFQLAKADSASPLQGPEGKKRSLRLKRLRDLAGFPELEGTDREARKVLPFLEKFAGARPAVYLREKALEGTFKQTRNPKVLVLSTHGFFLEDEESRTQEPNPLLRCGLILAGAENRHLARPDQEDGILYGLEIVGADLRGTELVVLSACQTGLGDIHSGEGVAGLRQAFHLAGARTVVATLWQVPDLETAELMGKFFANLADRGPVAESLRRAQLACIDGGASHPFFWAALTVTGPAP